MQLIILTFIVIYFWEFIFIMLADLNTNKNTVLQHPRIGVACVIQKNEKILLGKRKEAHGIGYWGMPGGHLEFREKVENCAKRELLEETGLKTLSLHVGPWVENIIEPKKTHYITIFVFIDSFVGKPALLEPNKCEGWKWFNWKNLPQPLYPSIPSAINKHPDLFYQVASVEKF